MTMISFDYRGKSVVVTGAGRGLGFAIAGAFLRAGATVIVNDRTAAAVEAAIQRLGGGQNLVPAPWSKRAMRIGTSISASFSQHRSSPPRRP
jgi:NAD(P)-dependent dehydrogenase (short-subunit alcohol dehydrogenase family)